MLLYHTFHVCVPELPSQATKHPCCHLSWIASASTCTAISGIAWQQHTCLAAAAAVSNKTQQSARLEQLHWSATRINKQQLMGPSALQPVAPASQQKQLLSAAVRKASLS